MSSYSIGSTSHVHTLLQSAAVFCRICLTSRLASYSQIMHRLADTFPETMHRFADTLLRAFLRNPDQTSAAFFCRICLTSRLASYSQIMHRLADTFPETMHRFADTLFRAFFAIQTRGVRPFSIAFV